MVLTGKKIKTLKDRLSGGKTRVVAIFRQGQPISVSGEVSIETGDEVFLLLLAKKSSAF